MPATMDRGRWPQLLKEFSRRNAGRRTRLQIDDADYGAQWSELELRFRGAAYEPRYVRVELMMSDGSLTDHLTHSVEAVTQLDVRQDASGRDEVLRLAHPGGQTLLFLAPDAA